MARETGRRMKAVRERDNAHRIATASLDYIADLVGEFTRSGILSSATRDRMRDAVRDGRAALRADS
jgi:hypothetical protein